MRILLVVDGMHPQLGGPPRVVAGSAIALTDLGHHVTVLSTGDPEGDDAVVAAWPELRAAGVTLEFCDDEGLRGYVGLSRARDTIGRLVREADVVHLHGVWHPAFLAAAREARARETPYFVSVHGVFDHRAMRRIRSKWFKKRVAFELFGFRSFLRGSAGVVFGSESEAEQSWVPVRDMKVVHVPNGVEASTGQGALTSTELERLHARLPQVRDWSKIVLCRSRFHEEKGVDLLIQAFNRVTTEIPEARLLIAGIRQDEDYESRFMAMIRSGPARERIAVTSELVGEQYQFLYKVGDIFVMPSIAEGFSVALVEGLAYARPLLITRYCHMPIVAEAGSGLVVDPTVEAIADGLRDLLARSPEELGRMGNASRRLFEQHFTWERVAGAVSDLYTGAVAGAPRR